MNGQMFGGGHAGLIMLLKKIKWVLIKQLKEANGHYNMFMQKLEKNVTRIFPG